MIYSFKKFIEKKKISKYIIAGSFFFFLIKGLIWLVIIATAWFGIGNL
tara:strand:+ start:33 stop:176 length:144 start_codon:yes stop_codon:yes gene_type:complete